MATGEVHIRSDFLRVVAGFGFALAPPSPPKNRRERALGSFSLSLFFSFSLCKKNKKAWRLFSFL